MNYRCPIATIITPAYKKSDMIFQTIDSIVSQTYPNIEYIIVDDGPNAIDQECVRKYILNKKSNIVSLKIIKNVKNIGIAASLNKGILKSNGKYIFNVADDDCLYDSNVIFDWVNEFESTDADIITAKRATYSSDMTTFLKIEPNDKVIDHIKYDSVEDLFEFMNGCNYIFGSVTAKTKKLLESFPYDEEYKLIEDYSSIMKLLRMGYNIHFFNRIVVKYRLGGISYAQNISKLYLKESNKLFINEILPYSKYKIKAIKNYIAWRRNIAKSK